jgi:hypothetical protein
MTKSFFPRDFERLRESKNRRGFPFSEKKKAAEKRHEFQGREEA